MTRKLCATIAVMVLIVSLSGVIAHAGEDDRLEPCQVTFPEYEHRIEAISQAATPGEVDFWVTVIPSFQPEWSVGVSTLGGKHLVTHVAFRQSLWGRSLVQSGSTSIRDFSRPQVQTAVGTASISAGSYSALRSEWIKSIADINPKEGNVAGNGLVRVRADGVIFEFKCLGAAVVPGRQTKEHAIASWLVW
jgi:hypothetical protein